MVRTNRIPIEKVEQNLTGYDSIWAVAGSIGIGDAVSDALKRARVGERVDQGIAIGDRPDACMYTPCRTKKLKRLEGLKAFVLQ